MKRRYLNNHINGYGNNRVNGYVIMYDHEDECVYITSYVVHKDNNIVILINEDILS